MRLYGSILSIGRAHVSMRCSFGTIFGPDRSNLSILLNAQSMCVCRRVPCLSVPFIEQTWQIKKSFGDISVTKHWTIKSDVTEPSTPQKMYREEHQPTSLWTHCTWQSINCTFHHTSYKMWNMICTYHHTTCICGARTRPLIELHIDCGAPAKRNATLAIHCGDPTWQNLALDYVIKYTNDGLLYNHFTFQHFISVQRYTIHSVFLTVPINPSPGLSDALTLHDNA